MAPIRVLQVMPAMDAGGMETFVMNVYRAIDRTQVQFDFLYHYDKPCFYDEEIQSLGGQITKLTVRQDNNIPRYLHQLDRFFAGHPYRILPRPLQRIRHVLQPGGPPPRCAGAGGAQSQHRL